MVVLKSVELLKAFRNIDFCIIATSPAATLQLDDWKLNMIKIRKSAGNNFTVKQKQQRKLCNFFSYCVLQCYVPLRTDLIF